RCAQPEANEKSGKYRSVTSTAPEKASASTRLIMYAFSTSERSEAATDVAPSGIHEGSAAQNHNEIRHPTTAILVRMNNFLSGRRALLLLIVRTGVKKL